MAGVAIALLLVLLSAVPLGAADIPPATDPLATPPCEELVRYCPRTPTRIGRSTGPFNPSYIFPTTRESTASNLPRWAVAVLAPLTLALDIAFLPWGLALGLIDRV